ncbi:metallophosphoesterase family protein [Brevirhabdus sp.]|uniref:metallophosphoesterase family protein n=1 Tax=Brevirhabdus sp. TaxID=2004514 RepID=UPI004058E1D7
MRRIVHLSDIHFGRDRADLETPLLAAINAMAADLVVISGDFTQRARESQFRRARTFLDRIAAPTLCVPGNHDTPLDNLFVRLLTPWARYRRHIDEDLEPAHIDAEVAVIGVNTVNPYVWQRGRIARKTVRRVCDAFRAGHDGRFHVVALHHPLEHGPEETKSLTKGAGKALDRLGACGADIVLSGHLHTWRAEPFARKIGRDSFLQVQAGTGLSSRVRGEDNDFNLLILDGDRVEIHRHTAPEGHSAFALHTTARFRRTAEGWQAE